MSTTEYPPFLCYYSCNTDWLPLQPVHILCVLRGQPYIYKCNRVLLLLCINLFSRKCTYIFMFPCEGSVNTFYFKNGVLQLLPTLSKCLYCWSHVDCIFIRVAATSNAGHHSFIEVIMETYMHRNFCSQTVICGSALHHHGLKQHQFVLYTHIVSF